MIELILTVLAVIVAALAVYVGMKTCERKDDPVMRSILEWFAKAKPNPSQMDAAVQVGCHYEEVAEMLEATNNADSLTNYTQDNECDEGGMRDLANFYKGGFGNANVVNFDRKALLDALCDQIVTALGVGYMMGFDMMAALDEVNRSNWSKFENGRPVFKEGGKITKGKNYKAPNLDPYVGD